jgi:formate dehydrogenase iron-sulfur subunit
MVALAERKVAGLKRRGFEHAMLYNPAGVGGTHMMYVIPHGDRLDDYQLPDDPRASPGPLRALGTLRKVGAYLFGFGLLSAIAHYLRVGPEAPDADGGATGGLPT